MLALDLQKNLQVSKSTGNSGVMMWLSRKPTVCLHWAKLTGIHYKEWRIADAWTTDRYTISHKKE